MLFRSDYGSLGVLGGDHGMVGAALLAGRAALQLGAGRVYLGLIADGGPHVDPTQPELMIRSADELLKLAQLEHLWCARERGALLLLDDLPSELDADSRARVFRALRGLPGQVFITAIERAQVASLLAELPVKVFHVEHGKLLQAP